MARPRCRVCARSLPRLRVLLRGRAYCWDCWIRPLKPEVTMEAVHG